MNNSNLLIRNYELTKSLLEILYKKIIFMRKETITRLISDELIANEEKCLILLALMYVFQSKSNYKKSEECYLNVLNIIKILNSSNFDIKAIKEYTTSDIVNKHVQLLENKFQHRLLDIDIQKFIKSIQIIQNIICNYIK
ncbi:hypothetical protein HZS_4775 [Henneguya salminicola]|nr:hypothetical protein HZS_4775 [Henneguya salminicola]